MAAIEAVSLNQLLDEMLDFFLSQPTLDEIAEYQISEEIHEYIGHLLQMNRESHLNSQEQDFLDEVKQFNHVLSLLKIQAHKRLARS